MAPADPILAHLNKKGTPGHALVTANLPLNKTSLPNKHKHQK